MDFVAFDFETADYASSAPCSLGLAIVKDGKIVDVLNYLINPETEFSPYSIKVHGITPEAVHDAPTFPNVWAEVMPYFWNYSLVAHNAAFDVSVLRKACIRYGIDIPETECYCTMTIAREQLHIDNLKLTDLCSKYGIACECHHNAESDAVACANLMLHLIDQGIPIHAKFSGHDLADAEEFHVAKSTKKQIKKSVRPADIHQSVEHIDESNPLYGKHIVFTGELSIDRRTAMQIAVDAGALVKSSVSRKTTYIVVGEQDKALVGDDGLSTKEEKAYQLNASGTAHIEFLNEDQFLQLAHGEVLV